MCGKSKDQKDIISDRTNFLKEIIVATHEVMENGGVSKMLSKKLSADFREGFDVCIALLMRWADIGENLTKDNGETP